ncbi:MAG: alpha/beta hydrolase, partial [Comamonadaceae bacterium]
AVLTRRIQDASAWVADQPQLRQLPLGYFGASAGSAAALIAAARLGGQIAAVVSRSGRPDLAGRAVLAAIKASTLLIVGGTDAAGVDLHQQAYQHLRCERSLAVVPGASHLFEEPGAMEQVAEMAANWFQIHMPALATA